jgi:hypothetical protein
MALFFLTPEQIKVITDLTERGAIIEITDPKTKQKIIIKKEKEEIIKLFPEFYGMGINLKSIGSRIKNYFKTKKSNPPSS